MSWFREGGEALMTITLEEIYKDLDEKNEVLFISRETATAGIIDFDERSRRLFKIVSFEPMTFEEITVDYDKMAYRIASAVSTENLIKEALKIAGPETILEIKERLDHPEASIKSGPGCFEVNIGGKQGAPFSWVILE